jgi:3-oxoacyl-[acyl-carrier protein] reductase
MKKKVVLVTGAGRGIGHAIALAFAKEGYDVAVFDVLPEDDVVKNMDALKDAGAKTLYFMGDVSKALDRSNALDAVRKTLGGLNVLVNNAGVAPKVRADVLDATEESWERVMKINLQGPYFLTQLAARWMIDQRKADKSWNGCIINISSTSAEVASISRGEYCVSKAGVSMATKLWSVRLSQEDIPVYEIRPGIIMTDMTSVVKEKYDKLIADGILLQKRWGLPEDIAKCAAMMARGDVGYSTGQVVNVDGGFTIARL